MDIPSENISLGTRLGTEDSKRVGEKVHDTEYSAKNLGLFNKGGPEKQEAKKTLLALDIGIENALNYNVLLW